MLANTAEGARAISSFFAERGVQVVLCQPLILDERTCERRVVRYSLHVVGPSTGQPERIELIGKFYSDTSGKMATEITRQLGARLSTSQILAVPRVIHYDERLNLQFLEHVPGSTTPFECPDHEIDASAWHAAGRALSELHSLPPHSVSVCSIVDHINELIRPHPRELVQAHPACESLVTGFLEWAERCDRDWVGRIPAVTIHRDFQLRQLFHDAGRIWLIDWDTCAVGDAAFDVAYFLVYLKNHLQPTAFDLAATAFVQGYVANGVILDLLRLPVYMCLNYIRRACRRLRLRDRNWQAVMQSMLDEAAAILKAHQLQEVSTVAKSSVLE